MAQTSKTILSKLSSLLTTLSSSKTSPLDIPQTDITPLSLRFYQNPDQVSRLHENSDLFSQIDPILELKSPSRVKPKGQTPGAKNKKRWGAQAGLDQSTRHEPSRFEHEKARISHSTRSIDENSSIATISKKGKAKRMKSHGGMDVLESRVKYNPRKKNKTVVEKSQVALKTVGLSTQNTRKE